MQQYFVNTSIEENEKIYFDSEQSHHIKKVLRMKEGTVVRVVGTSNTVGLAEIGYDGQTCYGEVIEVLACDSESKVKMTLCMGLIKKDKWDFCIQKACECGATTIVPFVSSRSVVKVSEEKSDKKLLRWNKIALEACEQSKRSVATQVSEVVSFKELMSLDADLKIIAYEDADVLGANLAHVLKEHPTCSSMLIAIGPEGGFERTEIDYAVDHGFVCVSLGKRILRAETAAMSALTMVSYHYDMLEG